MSERPRESGAVNLSSDVCLTDFCETFCMSSEPVAVLDGWKQTF